MNVPPLNMAGVTFWADKGRNFKMQKNTRNLNKKFRDIAIADEYSRGVPQTVIAKKYGISQPRICVILNNKGFYKSDRPLESLGCSMSEAISYAGDNSSELIWAYQVHLYNARSRNIPWLLSFKTWLDIWRQSGHIEERGRGTNKYVMARIGDIGAYSPTNVYITLFTDNIKDGWDNNRHLNPGRKVRK